MTMYPNSVVESFNVFEDQRISIPVVGDPETIKPFSLYKRVERFDAGVVIRIAFVAVTKWELLRYITVYFGDILSELPVESSTQSSFFASKYKQY